MLNAVHDVLKQPLNIGNETQNSKCKIYTLIDSTN